jgi:hypothetical protein
LTKPSIIINDISSTKIRRRVLRRSFRYPRASRCSGFLRKVGGNSFNGRTEICDLGVGKIAFSA